MTKEKILEQLAARGIQADKGMTKNELLALLEGKTESVAGEGALVMLGNVKHNGVFYKKGERVTLDAETSALFLEKEFATATNVASSVPASSASPQSSESSEESETQGESDEEIAEEGEGLQADADA